MLNDDATSFVTHDDDWLFSVDEHAFRYDVDVATRDGRDAGGAQRGERHAHLAYERRNGGDTTLFVAEIGRQYEFAPAR